jgi:2-desacetyl-2-hydroxyethyl bacteriochlorophyllide A dehydrogenase
MTDDLDNAATMSTYATEPTQARAFWVAAPGRGELRSETLDAPSPGQVLVEACFSGISRGTEALVFRGDVPQSEYQRMRAPFQDGDFPGPVKYGYASVGRVIDGDPTMIGQRVFCLFPHQTHYKVPASAVIPLPDRVPSERAVLAANLETALNGLWDSGASAGDRISIVGGGVVGALLAWLAGQLPGAEVTLIDINPARRTLAEALGVRFALPDQAEDGQDVVVHTSASAKGLETALALAGFEARVVEMSWYGRTRPEVALGEAFHAQRLRLISSQVGQLPPGRRARWTYRRRLAKAISLLVEPALDQLISGETPFDQLPDLMPRLGRNDDGSLCHRIRYPAASSP